MSSVRHEKIQAFPGPGGPDSGPLGPDFGEFRAPAPGGKIYLKFLNGVSWPEVVYCWSLNGAFLLQNRWEKVGGDAPICSNGLCGRRGPLGPQQSTISGPKALLSNLSQIIEQPLNLQE